jgi:hypothetical protein
VQASWSGKDLKECVYKGARGGEDVDRSVARLDVEFSGVAVAERREHTRKRKPRKKETGSLSRRRGNIHACLAI